MDGRVRGWMIVHMRLSLGALHPRTDRSVAPHRHEFVEWHYAVAGNCVCMVDGHDSPFAAGDLLAIPARTLHCVAMRRPGQWLLQIVLAAHLEGDEDEALQAAWDARAGSGCSLRLPGDHHAFFAGLARDLASSAPLLGRAASLRFTALLCEQLAGGSHGTAGHPVVAAALGTMRCTLDRPLRLAELARSVGCGRSLLARRFRAEVGETPMAHHLHMRLELAAVLLGRPGARVGVVASEVGFTDPYHFSRCFHRRFGRPPSSLLM